MPEPDGDLLVELTVESQDEPWTRRVCTDGAVWEHTNLRTWIEEGQVRQEHQPLRWERVEAAARTGTPIVMRLSLLGKRGGPAVASVPHDAIQWEG